MSHLGLMFSVGGVPLYMLRIFPTTFVLSVTSRLKPDAFVAFPEWLRSTPALWILGILAIAEILATKNPEFSELLNQFDREIKAVAYFVYGGIVLKAGAMEVSGGPEVFTAGIVPSWTWIWSALIAAVVWILAGIRQTMWTALIEMDDDDSLGVRRVVSWAEDGWVIVGSVMLVFLPLLALFVSAITIGCLIVVQKTLKAREKRLEVPCTKCGKPINPSAIICPFCRAHVVDPVEINSFGQPTQSLVTDLNAHRLLLISKRRCMVCASRLPKRALQQKCGSCGTIVLPREEWFDAYLQFVDRGLAKTLAVSFGFALIPVVGLIPGIVYYRFGLISNLRRYVPGTIGCVTRWGIRIVNVVLLSVQWIPVVGAFTLPAMCLTNYFVYRAVLRRERDRYFGVSGNVHSTAGHSISTV